MFLQEPWLSADEEGEDERQRRVGGKRFFVSHALPLDRNRDDDGASVPTAELYQKRPIEKDEPVGRLKDTIGTILEGPGIWRECVNSK